MNQKTYNTYHYKGPVTAFGRVITESWEGYTNAVSEGKARSNLAYQYKRENKRSATSRVELPGKIENVTGRVVYRGAMSGQITLEDIAF